METAEQMAAARKRFGGIGPPGTIRYPANAPNTTAVVPNDKVTNGSTSICFATTVATSAATATIPAVTARLLWATWFGQMRAAAPSPADHTYANNPSRCDQPG